MKNKFLLALSAFALFSCSEDDFSQAGAQPIDYKVSVTYDETFDNLAAKNITVKLKNTNTSDEYTMATDAQGNANFGSILPGTYDINATVTLSAAEFNATFGYAPETEEVVFNANLNQIVVNTNNTMSSLTLKTARLGDLVIKQIYYGGSHAQQGASFRDQFIEIFNNSNEVIYADGLYVAQVMGKQNNTSHPKTQSNGQWDWSQSLGMTIGNKANTDYVYADYVFQIPGNGTQYPIQPGESIVIAQSAQNHKAPLVDLTGEPISIQNPDLTIDLSTADFEAYLGNFRISIEEEPYKYDLANPAVPDLLIGYWGREGYWNGNKDFLMDNLGRDSYVIFRTETLDYKDFPTPDVTEIVNTGNSQTKFNLQIPVSIIIDGVETQHANTSSALPQRLPSTIDNTSTKITAPFTSKSVMRKTKTTANGRKILQDTNNSAADFVEVTANPKGFAN